MKELALENCRLDGRYEVRRMLGRGSYAEVYLATDTLAGLQSAHRGVVIKALNVFMHDDLDRDLERTLVENFQNEAIALDRVRHPNIISRLGHGTARDLNGVMFHYLVLEYLPGGDLAKFARKRPLTFTAAMRLLEQVCSGLSHAHEKRVIHRDIKPQNLLLSEDHKIVKIADFGVARLSESEGPITRVGTNIYAPPEHSPTFSGKTGRLRFAELTPAADVYSLAKTAYVLLTSESPRFFSGRPIQELPVAVRNEPWAADLKDLLRKATDDDPRARHKDALAFWRDLSGLLELVPESFAHHEPSERPMPKPAYAPGYSPNTPIVPSFDTDRKLKLPDLPVKKRPGVGLSVMDAASAGPAENVKENGEIGRSEAGGPEKAEAPETGRMKRKGSALRNLGLTAAFLAIFALGIYATYNYVLSSVDLPAISSFFNSGEATALMNINLRSDASTDNPRIGLVTKGSRLKILGSSGHWYRIEVVEYGGTKPDPGFSDSGWISGKTRTGVPTISVESEQ